jgi:hypothetical protein
VLCYIFSLQWRLSCISIQPFPTRFHVKNISYIDGHLVHLIDTENNFWYQTTPGRLRNQAFKWHYLVTMLNFGSAAKSQILMMSQKTHSCIYFFVRPSCCCEKKTLTFDDDWQNDDNSSHVFFEPGQYTENKTNLIYEKVCWNR